MQRERKLAVVWSVLSLARSALASASRFGRNGSRALVAVLVVAAACSSVEKQDKPDPAEQHLAKTSSALTDPAPIRNGTGARPLRGLRVYNHCEGNTAVRCPGYTRGALSGGEASSRSARAFAIAGAWSPFDAHAAVTFVVRAERSSPEHVTLFTTRVERAQCSLAPRPRSVRSAALRARPPARTRAGATHPSRAAHRHASPTFRSRRPPS